MLFIILYTTIGLSKTNLNFLILVLCEEDWDKVKYTKSPGVY